MHIRLVRSGGFAGIRVVYELVTDTLPSGELKKVEALIDSADFFALPEKIVPAGKGADQFTYTITIDEQGASHTVQAGETSMPTSLRPLILYLMERGKKS